MANQKKKADTTKVIKKRTITTREVDSNGKKGTTGTQIIEVKNNL